MDNVTYLFKIGAGVLVTCLLIAASLRVMGVGTNLATTATNQLTDTLSNVEFMERYNGEYVDAATAKEALERFAGAYPEVLYTNGNAIYDLMVFTNNRYDSYLNPAREYLVNVARDSGNEVEIVEIIDKADESLIGSYDISEARRFQNTWNNLKEMLEAEYKISEYSKMISDYAELYAESQAVYLRATDKLKTFEDNKIDYTQFNSFKSGVEAGSYDKEVVDKNVFTDSMLNILRKDVYEKSVDNKMNKELSVKGGGN